MLGLEPTFSCGAMEWGSKDKTPCASCYLCHVVVIGRALRRVLREDGTLWWNQGLSQDEEGSTVNQPARIADALVSDGWTCRRPIILAKRNPMPERTDNRPTASYEVFLLLTKATANTYWTHRDGRGAREQPEADYRWVREIENVLSAPTA